MKQLIHCATGVALCWAATDAHANFACQANPADFLGRVDKWDSQKGEYLIQGVFWGGHVDPGFDERRRMGVS